MPRVTESVHVGGQAVNGGLVSSKQTAVAQRKRAQHGAASAGRRGQAVQLARAALSKEQQVEHLPACWGVQSKFLCLPMTSRSEGAGRRRATAGFGRGRR